MTKSKPSWLKLNIDYPAIFFGLFLIAIGFFLYSNLGRDGLFDWDEGIYGELGRQIVHTKNVLLTSWNGQPWLEKPPGVAWVAGIGIALVGPTSLGARLLMPIFALYTLFVVYRIGKHLGGWKQGAIAAGVLAGLNLFLGRTRALNTDMPLLASIATTILFLLENRSVWWVGFSIFFGVWFKGIAGLMSLVIALPLIIIKPKRFIFQLLIALIVLIAPWHLYAYLQYGNDFLTPYFFEQVFRRATAQIEFHFESRWYYFNYLYENLGLGILLTASLGAITTIFKRKGLFLLWWTLIPLALFTLAKTRLFWYILPIYPAIALLISQAFDSFASLKSKPMIYSLIAIAVMLQGVMLTQRSVEYSKKSAILPDRLQIALALNKVETAKIHALVPKSERLSEALLPEVAKLSSSFRYGGMPSFVFYSQKEVVFYYDVDKFRQYWNTHEDAVALISVDDIPLLGTDYKELATSKTYLGIAREKYADR